MDSASTQLLYEKEGEPYASLVDPFLVEALQNPRHRLTILRMEFDIQRFLQNPNQQQFEFQHLPTSYLRLAAHRVAQHYGLQTIVQDLVSDGLGNKIIAWKTTESKYPGICLSEIPAKQQEIDKPEHIKIAIRPRPKASLNGANEFGGKRSHLRTVEERKEEYDRARARIFSSPGSSDSDDNVHQAPTGDGKTSSSSGDDNEGVRNSMIELEKIPNIRDGGTSSRVAILRDREKDRTDPDYDRSYERYVRNLSTNQTCNLAPFSAQKIQYPFVRYDTGFSQLGQIPRNQAGISYGPSSNPILSSFSAAGLNQSSRDSGYMQWASPAMMYAQSYEQFRHVGYQAPFCQQPLSFDYSQNH